MLEKFHTTLRGVIFVGNWTVLVRSWTALCTLEIIGLLLFQFHVAYNLHFLCAPHTVYRSNFGFYLYFLELTVFTTLISPCRSFV